MSLHRKRWKAADVCNNDGHFGCRDAYDWYYTKLAWFWGHEREELYKIVTGTRYLMINRGSLKQFSHKYIKDWEGQSSLGAHFWFWKIISASPRYMAHICIRPDSGKAESYGSVSNRRQKTLLSSFFVGRSDLRHGCAVREIRAVATKDTFYSQDTIAKTKRVRMWYYVCCICSMCRRIVKRNAYKVQASPVALVNSKDLREINESTLEKSP